MSKYDLIVVGSGPGGYVAAIRAAQLGFKVAIVEREHLGGICLNWGCIPTKALLKSAEVFHTVTQAANYGLEIIGSVKREVEKVVARSRRVSARLNAGVDYLMKKNKIDVIWGEVSSISPGSVVVQKSAKPPMLPQHPPPKTVKGPGTYQADHIILATGARPRVLPGLEPDARLIWTYFEAMIPEKIPESVVIAGSGAIGVEFASFYQALGSRVILVEALEEIMPVEDPEVSKVVRKAFEKRGVIIHTGTKIVSVQKENDSVTVFLEDARGQKSNLKASRLISAVGVVGNTENLGLEKAGVAMDRGCVVVNNVGATNVKGIYAIGDVAGPPMLAHKAEHEGVACVEAIKGLSASPIEKTRIPGCTYCHPQVASVGLTEKAAKEKGFDVNVGRFSFSANGKAIALGDEEGFVKTVFNAKTGALLGAHMVGPEVTELIHGFVVAMELETTEQELMHSVFPHPTLSEAMKESVLSAYGRTLNA